MEQTLQYFQFIFTQCENFRAGRRNQFWPRVPGGDLESRVAPPTAAHRGYNPVLKYVYISLILKMINGFSWPLKIMVSPFNSIQT